MVGLDDPEGGDLAVAVAVVGPNCLISSGMDLHGNVSRTLAETVVLLTTYRTARRLARDQRAGGAQPRPPAGQAGQAGQAT